MRFQVIDGSRMSGAASWLRRPFALRTLGADLRCSARSDCARRASSKLPPDVASAVILDVDAAGAGRSMQKLVLRPDQHVAWRGDEEPAAPGFDRFQRGARTKWVSQTADLRIVRFMACRS